MRAWVVRSPAPITQAPLALVERAEPVPGPGEVRIAVSVCGVCRTDLHLAEGDVAPRHPAITPGHEVVGVVDAVGPGCSRFAVGDRAGIAWLRHTCGLCRFCLRGDENLCTDPAFTGWDAHGGYADKAVIDEAYAYRLPDGYSDEEAAPLLCAGIIGLRALQRAALPEGGHLGIYGFGASAHITAQLAMIQGASVHVLTRSAAARDLARQLGVASVGEATAEPPHRLDAAILFAPAGELVPVALSALDRGGTLAIAGIHLSDIPVLNYQRHLFEERQVRSVTANTRADGELLMQMAADHHLEIRTTGYAFEHAADALVDLAQDRVNGAAVIHIGAAG
jgi:propanol-preferring alcohol dehydrogenase